MELFPDISLEPGKLTTVSISQRTKNDMSAWSPDVEDEREELLKNVSCLHYILLKSIQLSTKAPF